MKTSKMFSYNVITLIDQIRNHPCVWDKTSDEFRDRTSKQRAWDEICAAVDKDYTKKDKRERKRIAESIISKWHNVRDAFVKSLKKMQGHPTKKYIYYDKLEFLMKVIQTKDEEVTTEESKTDEGCSRKRARLQDDIDQEILKALRSSKSKPDEDEAFFISITPAVKSMTPENKLEFRMGVLQMIKDINSSEKNSTFLPASYSSSNSMDLDQEAMSKSE